MGDKKKVYNALIEGATEGLSDKALYDFVETKCGKTSSKKIVRASLLALTDPDVKDRTVLNTIYALAIKHRLDVSPPDTDDDEPAASVVEAAPATAKSKRRAKSTVSAEDAASQG